MKTGVKKPLLLAGAVASLGFASVAGVSVASADTPTGTGGPTALIDKLTTKFNLNKDEVKAVFDEEYTARKAEMQKHNDERLSKLVTDGKITAEQKDKIIAKQAELKTAHEAERGSMEGKTHEERKAAMEAKRAELEKWAKDNGIAVEYLRHVGGNGHHGGPRGGGPGGA